LAASFLASVQLLFAASSRVSAEEIEFRFDPPGSATSVYLAGDFNNWNPQGRLMADEDGDGIFATKLELPPGSYQYKFVVDGRWMEDPKSKDYADDGFGGKNSVLRVGGSSERGKFVSGASGATPGGATAEAELTQTTGAAAPADAIDVTFSYQPLISGVSSVHLAGEFNGWNTTATPMSDADGDGTYTVTIPLSPKSYEYKFLIDGTTWLEDPNAEDSTPDPYGGNNSVIHVGAKAKSGPAKLRWVTFEHRPDKKPGEIWLAGTFNNWTIGKTPMADKGGDGAYKATLLLPEGDYQYKFVADGSWITDMKASGFADDGFGGKNSVIVVDESFPGVDLERGDGEIFDEGLGHQQTVREVNWVGDREIQFTATAYANDVERVEVVIFEPPMPGREVVPLQPIGADAAFEYFRGTLSTKEPVKEFRYGVRYQDGNAEWYASTDGLVAIGPAASAEKERSPDVEFVFSDKTARRFRTPDWVRDGVFYQIFPERFANGNPSNDPNFTEEYYSGRTSLPSSGKKDGEYYHLVKDWYDASGLTKSPYRTDGKPDYFSFYGGDIEGVRQHLDYLADLGVSIVYFNPLFQARSNHKYEAYDYRSIDPHFGTPEEFRHFVDEAHSRGIRIVIDWVINHIGEHSPYFQDTVKKGKDSKYWSWFEWKKWPLPASEPKDWREYYECWWGFAHMPDLNYDLARPNPSENAVKNPAEAQINRPVVDYIVDSARYWVQELDVDGFRLDVPNEVPFWMWKIFREEVQKLKPDVYLVGEIWSDAGDWVSPDCFDATMNYKYFKDPVMGFLGKGQWSAEKFDRELATGRLAYPTQAVRVMMNLVGSHDTPRYLTAIGGDRRRLQLTALFAMTYVGAPHIYYGDEIATEGAADPDCRRPFYWKWQEDKERAASHDWYRKLIRLRRESPALITGDYRTLLAEGSVHSFARWDEEALFVIAMNAGDRAVECEVDVSPFEGAAGASFENVLAGGETRAAGGKLRFSLEPVSGKIVRLERGRGRAVPVHGSP
jgi:glycosidase